VQIIVNCVIPWGGGYVMLKKPRRGWWVCPGGKVDVDELWPDAIMREVMEETGLTVSGVRLRGIYTLTVNEAHTSSPTKRLLVQFCANHVQGTLLAASREGDLAIQTEADIRALPMDEGDRQMVLHTLSAEAAAEPIVYFGHFDYDANHALLDMHITPTGADVPAFIELLGNAPPINGL